MTNETKYTKEDLKAMQAQKGKAVRENERNDLFFQKA